MLGGYGEEQEQRQRRLPHPPPKEGGRMGHPRNFLLVTWRDMASVSRAWVLRCAQDDTSKTKTKTRAKAKSTTPPSAKRGGRMGHPRNFLLVTWRDMASVSRAWVLRCAQDDTSKTKTKTRAKAKATTPPSAKRGRKDGAPGKSKGNVNYPTLATTARVGHPRKCKIKDENKI